MYLSIHPVIYHEIDDTIHNKGKLVENATK